MQSPTTRMMKFMFRIFKACQTKPSSPPPENSSPPCHHHKATTGHLPCTTSPSPSNQTPHRSSFKTHFSSFSTKLYGVVSPRSKFPNSDNWFPLLPVPSFYEKKNRHKMKTNRPKDAAASSSDRHRFSTSYTVDDGGEGDEHRAEILSRPRRSFSDVGVRSRRHNVIGSGGEVSPEWGSPVRLSVFKKIMPCKVEGKVKESFAVVKRSEMPYEDFKKSMMEMIVENQMYEESDLKQLLQCFLSLNSWYHHGVIMEAFTEIWNTMSS